MDTKAIFVGLMNKLILWTHTQNGTRLYVVDWLCILCIARFCMPFVFVLYFLMKCGSFFYSLHISSFSVLKLESNFQVICPHLLTINHVGHALYSRILNFDSISFGLFETWLRNLSTLLGIVFSLISIRIWFFTLCPLTYLRTFLFIMKAYPP